MHCQSLCSLEDSLFDLLQLREWRLAIGRRVLPCIPWTLPFRIISLESCPIEGRSYSCFSSDFFALQNNFKGIAIFFSRGKLDYLKSCPKYPFQTILGIDRASSTLFGPKTGGESSTLYLGILSYRLNLLSSDSLSNYSR